MMKCPNCKTVKLVRKKYEQVTIHACEKCFGTLVGFDRLTAIKSRREKSEDELIEEIANASEDGRKKVRCPKCLRTMIKRSRKIGAFQFMIDRCEKCEYVWLDAGELAKAQAVYQFSEKGKEAQRFRERLENMTPAEKLELETRIANLPDHIYSLDDSDYDTIDYFDVWNF